MLKFYYLSTLFPSCPRKQKKIFSSLFACFKEFCFLWFSRDISKPFPSRKWTWKLLSTGYSAQSTYADKFEHAYKCFAGSGVELAAFCCTKDNKASSPGTQCWKFRFRTFTQEQSGESDFSQITMQHTTMQRVDLCLRSRPRCFPNKGFFWELIKKNFLELCTSFYSIADVHGRVRYWSLGCLRQNRSSYLLTFLIGTGCQNGWGPTETVRKKSVSFPFSFMERFKPSEFLKSHLFSFLFSLSPAFKPTWCYQ